MTNVTVDRMKDLFYTQTDLLQLKTPNFNCLIKWRSADVVINHNDASNARFMYLDGTNVNTSY